MACHFNSFMIEAPLQSKSISCRLVMKELVALLYNIVTLTHFFCFYLDSFIIFHFIFNFHFIVFVIVIIIIYTYFSRESFMSTTVISFHAAQKMKFSIKDFCSKCDQIRSFLLIWSHLLKKFLMEDFHRFHRFIQNSWYFTCFSLQNVQHSSECSPKQYLACSRNWRIYKSYKNIHILD